MKLNQVVLFACSLVLSLAVQAGESLSREQQAIVDGVDAHENDALVLLETVVNINSGTMNFEGVAKVGQIFSSELEQLGFETQWISGEAFLRAGHLLAKRGGSGPRILLIGHLDTVFAADSLFQTFERLDQNYARGPGVTDMKGGNTVIVLALKSLLDAGILDQLQVQVVMTGDEESRGQPHSIANAAMIEAAQWADYALGFEDGDGDPGTAVVARRSASSWQLNVQGKVAHSSQIFQPEVGVGAIFEAARILQEWRTALSSVPNLSFNPGVVVGGTDITLDAPTSRGTAFGKTNVVAGDVIVRGGIRALTSQQLEMARTRMQQVVDENLAHTSASLTFSSGYPPMAPRESNSKLLQRYSDISVLLGYEEVAAVDPRRAGAADISFVAEHVDASLDGLGLMGSGGHTVNETADLRTLRQQAARAALLMHSLR